MQTIKGYLMTFLAVLAGVAALWLGTLLFFMLVAFGAAAAIAFWLGTGPTPITLRLPSGSVPAPGNRAPSDRSTSF